MAGADRGILRRTSMPGASMAIAGARQQRHLWYRLGRTNWFDIGSEWLDQQRAAVTMATYRASARFRLGSTMFLVQGRDQTSGIVGSCRRQRRWRRTSGTSGAALIVTAVNDAPTAGSPAGHKHQRRPPSRPPRKTRAEAWTPGGGMTPMPTLSYKLTSGSRNITAEGRASRRRPTRQRSRSPSCGARNKTVPNAGSGILAWTVQDSGGIGGRRSSIADRDGDHGQCGGRRHPRRQLRRPTKTHAVERAAWDIAQTRRRAPMVTAGAKITGIGSNGTL